MKRLLCAVYDSASQTFGQPMYVVARGQAVRAFSDEVQRRNPDNALSLHPEDFELYLLGEFEDTNGALTPVEAQCLVRGKDVAIKEQ